jgi:hypothetical protein
VKIKYAENLSKHLLKKKELKQELQCQLYVGGMFNKQHQNNISLIASPYENSLGKL